MADGKSGVLAQLVEELNANRIRIVDLTTTLGPTTPVIDLPPNFAPSPPLTLTEISRYVPVDRHGTGTSSTSANTPARISMLQSTGLQEKIIRITRRITFRSKNSSLLLA